MTLTKASFFGEPTEDAEEDRQGMGTAMPEQMGPAMHEQMNRPGGAGRGSKRVGGGGIAGAQGVPGQSLPSRSSVPGPREAPRGNYRP